MHHEKDDVCTRCGGRRGGGDVDAVQPKQIEPYTSSGSSTSYVGWIVGIIIAFLVACFVLFSCQNSDSDLCKLFRDMYR